MTYEVFKAQYTNLFEKMMAYSPSQVGSQIYAEKMSALSDEYPAFADRAENE